MEKCDFEGTEINLPIDLIENPEIFAQVLSFDTWKHVLTPEDRNRLKNYLPVLPTDYPHAQHENLRALFDGSNFKFGNPLETFRKKLQAGHYASDISKYRQQCKTAKNKEYKLRMRKYYRKLVNSVLVSRQEVVDKVLLNSQQEAPITLSWHERQIRKSTENVAFSGKLESRYRKIIKEVKDECEDHNYVSSDEELPDVPSTTPSYNQNLVTEDDYHKMLCIHKRRRLHQQDHPDLDTHSVTLEDIIARTNVTGKKVLKAVCGKNKNKGKDKKEHLRKLKKKRDTPAPVFHHSPPTSKSPTEEPALKGKIMVESPKLHRNKYLEDSLPCFFSLLRDIFLDLPNATAELNQLQRIIKDWQTSQSYTNSSWSFQESNWVDLILSALKYLSGNVKTHANNPSFVSLVIFKQKVHQWKWIGSYRDKDGDLLPLCDHWLETKDQVLTDDQVKAAPVTASINVKRTDYVVGPSTVDEKSDYRNQERDRYENPHKPFIYRMHGFESIVAPVKGVFTKESNLNKAREHSLLVSKRPPYVTILTLVRDAAARLPNGEGTRAEVCQLLKDSQYINPDATDGQIHTVVSGALDRLHYEKDPCVKYDNGRKVWIYLHKTRSSEEFEIIHEASAAAARAKKQMNQKQKLIKQQKSKEAAMSAVNPLQSSSTNEGGDGLPSMSVTTDTLATVKKKKANPKRPTGSPKKTEKQKVKREPERFEGLTPNSGNNPQTQLTTQLLSPGSLLNNPSFELGEHHEQNVFHDPTSSAFTRTSRLNSPYMHGMPSPVSENPQFEEGGPSFKIKREHELETKHTLTSSSSSSGSDSDSETSSGEDVLTPVSISLGGQQASTVHYSEPRMPFSNVMSLGQELSNNSTSDNTFGGW